MPDNYIYDVSPAGSEWPDRFHAGPYRDEEALINDLREYNQSYGLPEELLVHVYETDATRLGIGRKHLGTIRASTVLESGKVDMERVK